MILILRLAWRNLWRYPRRTLLTAAAIAFSALLLVFMITIQLGAYDTAIDSATRIFSGQLQVQRTAYLDKPKMRTSIPRAAELAAQLREDRPSGDGRACTGLRWPPAVPAATVCR